MEPRTLFQKVWDEHVVAQEPDRPAVLYIDLQLIHEVTSPQAFTGLRERGLKVRRPDKTVATMDHSTPTLPKSLWVIDDQAKAQLSQLERNCEEFGIELFALGDSRNGIVHVIGPERGLRSRARQSFAATVIRRRTARLVRSRLASGRARSSTCWPHSVCYNARPRPSKCALTVS